MNRRGFLGLLACAALDPERLLWIPGRKLISIPKPVLSARMSFAWEWLIDDDLNALTIFPLTFRLAEGHKQETVRMMAAARNHQVNR